MVNELISRHLILHKYLFLLCKFCLVLMIDTIVTDYLKKYNKNKKI